MIRAIREHAAAMLPAFRYALRAAVVALRYYLRCTDAAMFCRHAAMPRCCHDAAAPAPLPPKSYFDAMAFAALLRLFFAADAATCYITPPRCRYERCFRAFR